MMKDFEDHIIPEELLAKYFAGECSSKEAAQIVAWREKNAQNKAQFFNLLLLWQETGSLKPIVKAAELDTEKALSDVWKKLGVEEGVARDHASGGKVVSLPIVEEQKKKVTQPRRRFLRWAVVAMILLGMGISLTMFQTNEAFRHFVTHKTVEAGDVVEDIQLTDGTRVLLKEHSKLVFPRSFKGAANRLVDLEGEAFFEVKRDEEKPFVIEVGESVVKVLGTSFMVREAVDKLEVTVATGKVLVAKQEDFEVNEKAAVVLEKNERVVVKKAEPIQAKKQLENLNELGWATRKLNFNNEIMEVVVENIERAYGVDIDLMNPDINQCRLTAKFDNQDFETVLETLKYSLNLETAYKNRVYRLNGEGCK